MSARKQELQRCDEEEQTSTLGGSSSVRRRRRRLRRRVPPECVLVKRPQRRHPESVYLGMTNGFARSSHHDFNMLLRFAGHARAALLVVCVFS